MRNIVLYIATSIDGFIARKNGAVDWLEATPNPDQLDYGYYDFYNSIDTTVMGNGTYKEVLGFGVPFPYHDKENFVFSTSDKGKNQDVTFVSEAVSAFVNRIKAQEGKDIWLIGGGNLNTQFLLQGLIDELIISIMPITLGEGIPLFSSHQKDHYFTLKKAETFKTGVVQLHYKKAGN